MWMRKRTSERCVAFFSSSPLQWLGESGKWVTHPSAGFVSRGVSSWCEDATFAGAAMGWLTPCLYRRLWAKDDEDERRGLLGGELKGSSSTERLVQSRGPQEVSHLKRHSARGESPLCQTLLTAAASGAERLDKRAKMGVLKEGGRLNTSHLTPLVAPPKKSIFY